jgi:hypothetical protein
LELLCCPDTIECIRKDIIEYVRNKKNPQIIKTEEVPSNFGKKITVKYSEKSEPPVNLKLSEDILIYL